MGNTIRSRNISRNYPHPVSDLNRTDFHFPANYPGNITPDTLFDARTERIVKAQADKLVSTGMFEQYERDDVANELRIILAEEMAAYNPSSDRYAFAATILAKRGATLLRLRWSALQEKPRPLSLDVPVEGADGEAGTMLDFIPDERSAGPGSPEFLRMEAVKDFLATLSDMDEKICQGLLDGERVFTIAKRLKVRHHAVQYHIRKFIVPAAVKCGLDKFWEVAR